MGGVDNEHGWRRLADEVKRRRSARGWTQMEVATRGGMSLDRVSSIESVRTDRYSGRTIAALERGLGWEPGSIREILAGGDPTPTGHRPPPAGESEPKPEPTLSEALAQLAELKARVARLEGQPRQREDKAG